MEATVNYNLIQEKLEKFIPNTEEYINYWREEFRKIIEGKWIGNYFVSGPMYFYANYWTIEAKGRFINPLIRDVEREKFNWFEEARGFSGFERDDKYHCDIELYKLQKLNKTEDKRIYKTTREYLNKFHHGNLGRPLYNNQCKNVITVETRGCLEKNTEILMFDGAVKKVQDIIIGDKLMGKDGTERNVLSLKKGVSNMYKVESKKFKSIVVNENHTLSVFYKGVKTSCTVNHLLKEQNKKSFTNNYYRYLNGVKIPFKTKELPIDPYYLGLWLADGRSNCTSIKTTDIVLKDYIEDFYKKNEFNYSIKEIFPCTRSKLTSYECYNYDSNFRGTFKKLNLINNKHIPEIYKTSSINQRISLLSGIIDGDGCLDKKHNSIDIYCGLNESIADDCVYIARSLGYFANKNIRNRKGCKQTFEVIISGDLKDLKTLLNRKKQTSYNPRINVLKSSFKLTFDRVDEYFGFTLDKDNEYLLSDFTVDHNSGKTKLGSGLIGYTFITDGIKDLVKYKQFKKSEEDRLGYEVMFPYKSNSVISSIDSKYSNKVVDDFFIGYDKLRGNQTYNKVSYPSPIKKKYSGSLKAGSGGLTAKYEEKVDGNWTEGGSYSFIRHVTYFGNPAAANGFRSAFILDDEIGFHNNLLDTFGQLKQCTEVEGDKFGIIWLTGTGGDMKGGATLAAKEIFYNPEDYNCLVFNDIYENKGNIGCFIPRWKVLSEYKDSNGNTNEELAKQAWQDKYNVAKTAKDSSVLDMFLQNDPATPSHAFLSLDGNKYPTAQLQEQLGYLESLPNGEINKLAIRGTLDCNELGIVTFHPDLDNKLRDCDYPIKSNNKKGCVTIYKLPQDTTFLNYVGGLDPIEAEGKAHEIQSNSVASLVIVSRGMLGDEIVAEYTGREESLNDTNEIMRRLIIFYNAFTLYENNFNNFKVYMQSKNQLHFLAKAPNILKAGVGRLDQYGLHATKEGKEEMCGYTRNWLLEKNFTGEINIKSINSIGLLKELLASGEGVNTDRESALKLCIVLKLQLSLNIKKEIVNDNYFDFFNRRYDKEGRLIKR